MVETAKVNFASVDEIEARIAASQEANERQRAEIAAKQAEFERKFPKLTAVEEIDAKINKFTADMEAISAGFIKNMSGREYPFFSQDRFLQYLDEGDHRAQIEARNVVFEQIASQFTCDMG